MPHVGMFAAKTHLSSLVEQALAGEEVVLTRHGEPIARIVAEWAGSHPAAHRDPFDRMIAAQAILRGLSVVSSDPKLDILGAARVW